MDIQHKHSRHLQTGIVHTEETKCTVHAATRRMLGQDKGIWLRKAAIGGLILGPVGLLGGFIGKTN